MKIARDDLYPGMLIKRLGRLDMTLIVVEREGRLEFNRVHKICFRRIQIRTENFDYGKSYFDDPRTQLERLA